MLSVENYISPVPADMAEIPRTCLALDPVYIKARANAASKKLYQNFWGHSVNIRSAYFNLWAGYFHVGVKFTKCEVVVELQGVA